jgi:folate-binding protein YgfZ
MTTRASLLPDRGVIRVEGGDAAKFLQGLLTNDVTHLGSDQAVHAALLSPQGKILFEMFVINADDALFMESSRALLPDLLKRLSLYKLRADVAFTDLSTAVEVAAIWGGTVASDDVLVYDDPRLPGLGQRAIVPVGGFESLGALANLETPEDYHAHRILLGVPEAGRDYALGDTFPHEADMDELAGVDFRKGCFVGQEVVSRMQHRATVRKRVVPVRYLDGFRPMEGSEIKVGDAVIGYAGSALPTSPDGKPVLGLALLRIDKAADALEAGTALMCAGTRVEVLTPSWAHAHVRPGPANP